MEFKDDVYAPGEMALEIKAYLARAVKTREGCLCKCGAAIRSAFVATFPVNAAGDVLDHEETPRGVPYCPTCDPPDGFGHSYARRVFIRES